MPLISVVMPVYRAEKFLRGSVKSILDQTFGDLEAILVDDGSPDGSGALCEELAREDSRVKVIHKPNGGVSSARNVGLAAAEGEYIAFCDSDDSFEPTALETLYGALSAAEADSAGCGHSEFWQDGPKRARPAALPEGVYGRQDILDGIVKPLIGERLDHGQGVLDGFVWRFLFRTDIIRDNHLTFEGAYLEDELFLLEYFLHAEKLAVVDQPLYNYLWNPASATKRYMADYIRVFRRFMERKRAVVERSRLEDQVPGWEENSNWAGLLIAVGNEYAPGNSKTMGEKTAYLKQLCGEEDMARAISALHPRKLAGNKQLVADLIEGKHFWVLTLLYYLKNRGR